jgi:hypothetical protein
MQIYIMAKPFGKKKEKKSERRVAECGIETSLGSGLGARDEQWRTQQVIYTLWRFQPSIARTEIRGASLWRRYG